MADGDSDCGTAIGGYLTAFAIGALLGAGLAVIYAPSSGKETREALARRARELREKADSVVTGAKEAFREKKEHLAAAVKAGKEAMMEE